MITLPPTALHLTSEWFIVPGNEAAVAEAVPALVAQIRATEPDTLVYMVHRPCATSANLQSLPPANPSTILFYEVYRNQAAFEAHVNGQAYSDFVANYGDLFIQNNGKPYSFVEFLYMEDGFIRDEPASQQPTSINRHPAIMFEVLAKDKAGLKQFYSDVFDWNYDDQTAEGFAYVKFPPACRGLLGGIGQANASVQGFEAGNHFYLQVDDLQQAIDKAIDSGGKSYLPVTEIDGYAFAMVKDPEGNIIGLIKSV
ncbi:putative enzyme related to lactoylglutathione lyase/quinol monooxygenase YgiN [Oxalobacteraceae bacterium GrIS 1.11]